MARKAITFVESSLGKSGFRFVKNINFGSSRMWQAAYIEFLNNVNIQILQNEIQLNMIYFT